MTIPDLTAEYLDPGLGVTGLTGNVFCVIGCASQGTLNEVQSFSQPNAIVTEYGQGDLAEDLCTLLAVAGAPVYGCRVTGSTAGAAGSVTVTREDSSTGTITVAGTPYARYDVLVEILTTGTVGAGTFKYSLDNGRTYSPELTIPSGGDYTIPNTGLTLTFVPGAGAVYFEKGDVHTFSTTAPIFSTTELASAITALNTYLSTAPDLEFDALVLSGTYATGSAAATMAGALDTHLTSLETQNRPMGAIMDAGSGDTAANVKTAWAAISSRRINRHYGDADTVSSKPFTGYGATRRSGVAAHAARAAASLISTDLARPASGALTGVLKIYHDEFAVGGMEEAQISTFRTWPGERGFYITNAWLASPSGSDYRYWQHRRIMDVAVRTALKSLRNYSSVGLDVKSDGTIEETEAKAIDAVVNRALADKLSSPKNVEGRSGHVSDFKFTVDRTYPVLTNETLQGQLAIRPFGYAKHIVITVGYALNVG